ncbi:MAG: hypothetical protein IIA72_11345 [Proteobacteria bacterium]|nr:hypothetical protein [Pseudomonadota bacterium]
MKKHLTIAVVTAVVWAWSGGIVSVEAADTWPVGQSSEGLAQQQPIEVFIQLGSVDGDLVITPRNLVFEKGKLYTVVFKNPSDVEHRLSVVSVASAVKTLAKPVVDRGEVKGGLNFGGLNLKTRGPSFGYQVREINVAPGGIAEWSFIPVREASVDIGCKVDGHAKAGMVATINII